MTGADLKRIRTNGGVSQAEIARRSGVSRQRICLLEQGRGEAMLNSFCRILTAYGYTITGPRNDVPAIYPAPKVTKKMLSDWERTDEMVRRILKGAAR